MLKQFNTRLRDKAVITAAILSVFGHNATVGAQQANFGQSQNDNNTTSPIKHVIVIVGKIAPSTMFLRPTFRNKARR